MWLTLDFSGVTVTDFPVMNLPRESFDEFCSPRGDTSLYKLDGYLRPKGYGFRAVLVWNRVQILTFLV